MKSFSSQVIQNQAKQNSSFSLHILNQQGDTTLPTHPHQNNRATAEYWRAYFHQRRAGKALPTFSFRLKPLTLCLWNGAITLELSLAIIFAGLSSPNFTTLGNINSICYMHLLLGEVFLYISLTHFLSSSELIFASIALTWKEMGYFTDSSIFSPSPALH